jgi:prevent-host-death family protein
MTMIKVNIYQAKARLSKFLAAVEAGERVVICKRNHPVAELTRVGASRAAPRPVGGAKGQFSVPAAFFDPLPEEFVESFYPGAGSLERPPAMGAERSSGYAARATVRNRTARRRRR